MTTDNRQCGPRTGLDVADLSLAIGFLRHFPHTDHSIIVFSAETAAAAER